MRLDEYRAEFLELGCTMIPRAVSPEVALEWAARGRAAADQFRVDWDERPAEFLDDGEPTHHGILNGPQVRKAVPELFGWYECAVNLLAYLADRPVITSPYGSSAISLKVYHQPGDRQGWHYDTNPLTGLLILTETDGDYGTEVQMRDGTTLTLRNDPGDLWVMLGRELKHRVLPLPEGKVRVTVPLNYYHPNDTWRPEGMDERVYGS